MQKELSSEGFLQCVIEGIRNKKGQNIIVLDLQKIPEAPVECMVITQGNSTTQVTAIAEEVDDYVRNQTHVHPLSTIGKANGEWIALDYGTIFVHIMLPQTREYYNLEDLWADGEKREYKDE